MGNAERYAYTLDRSVTYIFRDHIGNVWKCNLATRLIELKSIECFRLDCLERAFVDEAPGKMFELY